MKVHCNFHSRQNSICESWKCQVPFNNAMFISLLLLTENGHYKLLQVRNVYPSKIALITTKYFLVQTAYVKCFKLNVRVYQNTIMVLIVKHRGTYSIKNVICFNEKRKLCADIHW